MHDVIAASAVQSGEHLSFFRISPFHPSVLEPDLHLKKMDEVLSKEYLEFCENGFKPKIVINWFSSAYFGGNMV